MLIVLALLLIVPLAVWQLWDVFDDLTATLAPRKSIETHLRRHLSDADTEERLVELDTHPRRAMKLALWSLSGVIGLAGTYWVWFG